MSIEAMKEALDALEEINKLSIGENAICLPAEIDTAMDALRQAIEQAEQQEPVAWLHPANATCVTTDPTAYARGIPLYTTPPPRQHWVGLTDEEKHSLVEWAHPDIIEAIELKLKARNT
jgi:hypothetical protein